MDRDAVNRDIERVVQHAEWTAETRENLSLVLMHEAPEQPSIWQLVDALTDGLHSLVHGPMSRQLDGDAQVYVRALWGLAEDVRDYIRDYTGADDEA